MVGRLIVALLVVCSAFAVKWQMQRSEGVDLSAEVAETKATEADRRADAAEERARKAEEAARDAEARAAFYQQQLADQVQNLETVDDEPVSPGGPLHARWARVMKLDARNDPEQLAHLSLALEGAADDVERITVERLMPNGVAMQTWSTEPNARPLVVSVGGKRVLSGPEGFSLKTRAGVTMLDLGLDAYGIFGGGATYRVTVKRADGHLVSTSAR